MTSGGLGLADNLGEDINQEELDFSELFLYNSSEEFPISCDKDEPGPFLRDGAQHPLLMDNHSASISEQLGSRQDMSSHSPSTEHLSGAVFECLGLESRPGPIRAPSPRIEITPSGDSHSSVTLEPVPATTALGTYRECVSPASSNSSTGWPIDAYSPVASPTGLGLSGLDLCPAIQGIQTSSAHSSPGTSQRNSITEDSFLQPQYSRSISSVSHQRSRSAPPHGKRSYDQAPSCQGGTPVKQRSRSPSPIPWSHEQQGSYYPHQYQAQASSPGLEMLASIGPGLQRPTQTSAAGDSHWQAKREDYAYEEGFEWNAEQEKMDRVKTEVMPETFYVPLTVWSPLAHHAGFSGLPMASFPSLEWPIPSKSGQYQLFIQQQPRSHHRAHYETEGSRGAVKTPNGGHPEVQLRGYQGTAQLVLQVYIGTADEKLLKPHAFYQVHRITGKTVTTPSMERVVSGTKVLEIPLEPKNNMRVVIDCVGILKLRNADIEQRNGETDIGRKNTRVRLVFRVHIPQPGGQLLSLQVASDPIECSQRSAQELPSVERQDLDRCSVRGGQQMVLTGLNFTSDSKVIFSEKTQDGKQIWEVEATVDKDKTQANMLFVEVPPYRDQSISHPAKVNFFVINGKKKRSQPQHFLYTPVIAIKAEPLDDFQLSSYSYPDNQPHPSLSMKSLYQHLDQDSNCRALNVSPTLYQRTTIDPRVHVCTPDVLDDQSLYYQSKGGALIGGPMLYSNSGSTLFSGSPITLHPSSNFSPCVGTTVPMARLVEAPQDPCLVSRYEGFIQKGTPLGKSPPMRYIHDQAQGRSGSELDLSAQRVSQTSHYGENLEERASEKVTIKQESLRYAYLEDVNDIIRRDLRGHNGQ